MNTNQFDAQIRAMFANEAAQPSQHAEAALFDRMAQIQKRKSRVLTLGAIMVAGATIWAGTQFMDVDEVPNPELPPHENTAVSSATSNEKLDDSAAFALPAIENHTPASIESDAAIEEKSDELSAVGNAERKESTTAIQHERIQNNLDALEKAPVNLEPVGTLPVAASQSASAEPSLQKAEEETWVLPAVVTVKD
tara:strand:- start:64 stop:648 length:585 start_codon:yes stop_codon:yes gene_type:complete